MKPQRIGLLYHKYIKDGPLERQNWNAERLAELLEAKGYIKTVWLQNSDPIGRWMPKELYYRSLKPFGFREVRNLTRSYPRMRAITSKGEK